MPTERKPGSNRGRAATDWNAAFLTYAALPPNQRSYQAVADQHGVSVRTVERYGRERHWRARAEAIDREAQAINASRLADKRAEKIGDVEKLVDASFVYYAGQIRDGKVKMSAADLRRLHELRGELWADPAAEQSVPSAADTDGVDTVAAIDPIEHKLEVLRALRDAGILDPLADPTADTAADADDRASTGGAAGEEAA